MADSDIKKQITFDGLTYNLDNRDRVAAKATYVSAGSLPTDLLGLSSGDMFVTSSTAITGSHTLSAYKVLCVKV